jgi:hypothetical protein
VINILRGNCIELLEGFTPDVLITDPPYSEHVHKSATSCGTPGARPSTKAKGAAHRDLGFSSIETLEGEELREFICKLAARTRRWSVIFTDTESIGNWKSGLEQAGATYIRAIPWVRWSMPQLSGDRPPQGHEMVMLAWVSQKGKKSWNGPGNLTHFAHTCMRGAGKHKAQKPLDLMLDLVEYFSNEGEVVCDPCMGSGTTGVAASYLCRDFVGCEMNEEWFKIASERINGLKLMFDDAERLSKYEDVSRAVKVDMARMAANTARIVANRKAVEVADTSKQAGETP